MPPPRQESNAKPQGINGPFPAFPFNISKLVAAGTIGIVSTNPIKHEFYITQIEHNLPTTTPDRSGIWIAPHGFTTLNAIIANGSPLSQNITPGESYWSYIKHDLHFMAGPYPKDYAIYTICDNSQGGKGLQINTNGVIAYDIYKDENYPTKRH